MICRSCGTRNPNKAVVCSGCGEIFNTDNGYVGYENMDMPMKWYKFLAFFYCWFSGIYYFSQAYSINQDKAYKAGGKLMAILFAYEPSIKIFSTIIFVITGIVSLIAGYTLLKYMKIAPVMVLANYMLSLIWSIIILMAVPNVLNLNALYGIDDYRSAYYSSAFFTIALDVVLIVCNVIYFRKRKHYFTN